MSELKSQDGIFQDFLDSRYIISHSQKTYKSYKRALSQFEGFVRQNHDCDVQQIIQRLKDNKIDVYELLNKYVIFLDKAGKRPASIKGWMPAVKGFLRQQGIRIYTEDSRALVRMPRQIHYREEPMTKEIISRLLNNLSPKLRAAVLVATASGMRIGEIVQLRISDIDFDSIPTKVRIRAETTKGKQFRETFLTREATLALQDYLKRTFNWDKSQKYEHLCDTVIFGPKFRTKKEHKVERHITATDSLRSMLVYSIEKIPDLAKLNENGRNSVHFHAFRKFFRTTVGDVSGRDFAEALMGHHFYLDTYYQLSEDKKRELYLKAEAHLTIADFVDIEKKLTQTMEKQKEFEYNQAIFMKIISERLQVPPEFLKGVSYGSK